MPIKKNILKNKPGFSLVELVSVVIIVGILAALAIANYTPVREQSLEREAIANLRLIAAAERIYKMEEDLATFITCANTTSCNSLLKLSLPATNWTYRVTSTNTNTNFTGRATRSSGPNNGEFITINEANTISKAGWTP